MEDEVIPVEVFESPETLRVQEEKLNNIKKSRDATKVGQALDAIARGCEEDENLMEIITESAKAYVTSGEISRKIKDVYGTWNAPLF